MAKKLEQRLTQVAELRKGEATPQALKTLEAMLAKEEGPVVARVADLLVEWGLFEQAQNLAAAFRRLVEGGTAVDPQCWGKVALIKALKSLSYPHTDVYVLGCHCIQMEKVWGGEEDSAPSLRAISAIALAECPSVRYEEALDVFVGLLVDPAWNVRAAAASATAQMGYPHGAPVLKLKILTGDAEAKVIGACLDGLLHLGRTEAIPFIQSLSNHPNVSVRLEAVCTLAASHYLQAIQAATQAWSNFTDPRAHKAILAALASSPAAEALEFILSLVAQNHRIWAMQALQTLTPKLHETGLQQKLEQVIDQNPNPKLRQELESLL